MTVEVVADIALQTINEKFIKLQDGEKHVYMQHFQYTLDVLIPIMKKEDKLFEAIFQRFHFAGSYFDGLKISKPEEYDVDLVMNIPVTYDDVEIINNGVKPPFIKIKMSAIEQLKKHPKFEDVYRPLLSWIDDDGFLLQNIFRQWMESVLAKARAKLPPSTGNLNEYTLTTSKSGPAMTLKIKVPIKYSTTNEERISLDIDLVPVIEFKGSDHWPPLPVRRNPFPVKQEKTLGWFIVPKPNSKEQNKVDERLWWFAFHTQESELINDKYNLKPVLRLMKKLRDAQNLHGIKSYFIKTVFLWQVQERPATYWQVTSASTLFVDMLSELRNNFKCGRISNYWDQRANLLAPLSTPEIDNIAGCLDNIVTDIISKKGDGFPSVFAKYLLTDEELIEFQSQRLDSRQLTFSSFNN